MVKYSAVFFIFTIRCAQYRCINLFVGVNPPSLWWAVAFFGQGNPFPTKKLTFRYINFAKRIFYNSFIFLKQQLKYDD